MTSAISERWVVEPELSGDYDEEEEDARLRRNGGNKRNKSYTSAKTLNDREQRKLNLKLSVFDKEMKSFAHKIDIEQKALRQELETINPDLQKDPNKGFFVPRGTTKEQEQRLREHRRSSTQMSTRSISLKEFDNLRKERSKVARGINEDRKLGLIEEGKSEMDTSIEDVKKRGRRGALFQPDVKPVSFTKMAKVISLLEKANTASDNDEKRLPRKKKTIPERRLIKKKSMMK